MSSFVDLYFLVMSMRQVASAVATVDKYMQRSDFIDQFMGLGNIIFKQ